MTHENKEAPVTTTEAPDAQKKGQANHSTLRGIFKPSLRPRFANRDQALAWLLAGEVQA